MDVLDVAIVGGGAAGCYCAYRLADSANYKNGDGNSYNRIELFEANDRIGGRLWSVPVIGDDGQPVKGQPIELGGNFISSTYRNVCGLVDHLNLETTPLNWSTMYNFLRGGVLEEDDFKRPFPWVPYRLVCDEIGLDYEGILNLALTRILGVDVQTLWPRDLAAEPHDTIERMKNANPRDRPLWRWGFWNLLAEKVSNEAYEMLLATYGAASNFRNSNAFDAIWVVLMELMQGRECFKITGGYDQLPKELITQAARNVPVNFGARLTKVERRPDDTLQLTFSIGDTIEKVKAKHAILALPPTALKAVAFGPDVVTSQFHDDVDAVDPIPACKLYLVFDNPWWDFPKISMEAVAEDVRGTWTDLPIRQCYYFDRPVQNERALMMASLSDDAAATFWARLNDRAPASSFGQKWLEVSSDLYGNDHMVHAALNQLSIIHGPKKVEPPVLPPVFVNWRDTPSGAGWHAWKPNRESWKVRARMRRPNDKIGLYVCGEGFSQLPGWVEGALNSAEMALAPFKLLPPEWVKDPKFKFEYPV